MSTDLACNWRITLYMSEAIIMVNNYADSQMLVVQILLIIVNMIAQLMIVAIININ